MARVRCWIQLDVKTPLLVGDVQTMGNYRTTGTVIPGRTWRGALAHYLLDQGEQTLFNQLFTTETNAVHFGPLFPASAGFDMPNQPPLVLPTLFSCKHYPGYEREPENGKIKHGVYDTLARQYVSEQVNAQLPLPGVIDELRCPKCHAPGDPYDKPPDIAEARVQSTTHVAINRARRTAADSQLYSREGVLPEDGYGGYLDIPEALLDKVVSRLHPQNRDEQVVLYIGANRSRGMGEARITRLEPTANDTTGIRRRRRRFNEYLDSLFGFYRQIVIANGLQVEYPLTDDRYFTLDLHSPAILVDQFGLPTAELALLDGQASVVRRWTSWQRVSGWHAAARLPRRPLVGITGTLLCRYNCPNPDAIDEALYELQSEGIGQLRDQGYGQLTVCHALHNEQTEI